MAYSTRLESVRAQAHVGSNPTSSAIMKKLRSATLVFLIKRSQDEITNICLAMKKRGFGMGRWNGVGGKVNQQETIEQGAIRETEEEIGVVVEELEKVAELSFRFPHKEEWNQLVHVYFTEKWTGKPTESEEMNPKWFSVKKLPFKEMWPDDIFWLPQVIKGDKLKAKFVFGEGDSIREQEVKIVTKIN